MSSYISTSKMNLDTITNFARARPAELIALIGLVTFAAGKKKLTPAGVVGAAFVAVIHMLDPFPVFFWLLVPFFLLGVLVTKIGHKAKAQLTKSATGASSQEGTRGLTQVFANSGAAAIMIAAHTFIAVYVPRDPAFAAKWYAPYVLDLQKALPIGIMSQYAAVAADTFGSELGILAKSQPFLIVAPWKKVPPGTNGGITVDGILYGLLASTLMTAIAAAGLYAFPPYELIDLKAAMLVCYMGVFGSILDSMLGATLQATVMEKDTGKVVEGPGGRKVMVNKGGSRIKHGRDVLSNNGVNLAMAVVTSLVGMAVSHKLKIYI